MSATNNNMTLKKDTIMKKSRVDRHIFMTGNFKILR